MPFDIKVIRPNVSSIIAGPFKTAAEAEKQADVYRQQEGQAKAEKMAKAKGPEKRQVKKFIAETETRYEVVPHKAGGI